MKNIDILRHIKEDIDDIISFTLDIDFERFASEPIIRKAVCMSLINIGELTKSLSEIFKKNHVNIPWKNIAGLRDVTAHKYHTLNLDIVWSVVIHEIPKLNEFIETELQEPTKL